MNRGVSESAVPPLLHLNDRGIVYKIRHVFAGAFAALVLSAIPASAQSRVGSDSATRLTRLGRDVLYGTAEGLGFSALDHVRNDPPEWGRGWPGYGKRVASNLGEFYIQEGVTEGLAALMNRPLDYTKCRCKEFDDRVVSAARGAIFDQMPNRSYKLAIPRIAGAYTGAFAQSTWRPPTKESRLTTTLVNGTTSLAIGGLINLYHEVRR
jgi:hypothetical protein